MKNIFKQKFKYRLRSKSNSSTNLAVFGNISKKARGFKKGVNVINSTGQMPNVGSLPKFSKNKGFVVIVLVFCYCCCLYFLILFYVIIDHEYEAVLLETTSSGWKKKKKKKKFLFLFNLNQQY